LAASEAVSVRKALAMGVRKRQQVVSCLAGFFVGSSATSPAVCVAAKYSQRTTAFGKGLLRQQHLAHVRVHDDRVGFGLSGALGPDRLRIWP
jgi:hypothetical protein